MLRHRLLVVVVVVCAYAVAGGAWAQVAPESGMSALELGRGYTGVALPSGHTTGVMNPATLGLLYRLPGERPTGMVAADGAGSSGVAMWRDSDFGRGLLAFPRGSEFGRLSLDAPRYEDALAAITPPAEWLAPEGDTGAMVTIESRFITVDQSFLNDVGMDWNINQMPVWTAGYTGDTEDLDLLQSFQATYGRIGGEWAFGGGVTSAFDDDWFRLAVARSWRSKVLAAPRVMTLAGQVAHIEVANENRFVFDLGAAAATDTTVFARPATASAGVVVHDVFDEFGDWGNAGTRLDLGAAISTQEWQFELDLADVFDRSEVRIGTQVKLTDNIFVLGGLIDDEVTYGARAQVPLLGNIPVIGLAFAHTDREDRVELMVVITPSVVRGDEE